MGDGVKEKCFGISEFKTLMLELLNASSTHNGIKLQALGSKIIDTYKETTMTMPQYEALIKTQLILEEEWRKNWK